MRTGGASGLLDPRLVADDLKQLSLTSFVDMARWVAAAMVMVGHLRNPLLLGWGSLPDESRTIWVRGWYFLTGFHAEAVLVFFVLSGFLVGGLALARTQQGRFDPPAYAIDRFSRLFIAFVPALLLTVVLDWLGARWFGGSGLYDGTHAMIVAKNHGIAYQDHLTMPTLLGNLAMVQYYFVPPLGSNDPLWTLSTEFWFYFVFGALLSSLLFEGLRRWILAAVACLAMVALGVEFLIYFGLWLIGFAVACLKPGRTGPPILPFLLLAGWLGWMRINDAMFDAQPDWKQAAHYVLALLFGWLILSMRRRRLRVIEWLAPFNKFMADFSYSLYLIHFPLLIFVIAALGNVTGSEGFTQGFLPTDWRGWGSYLGIIGLILTASWLFAQATERHTAKLRNWLRERMLSREPG